MAKLINEVMKLQKRAAILISEAFQRHLGGCIGVELFLTPMKLRPQQTIEGTSIRILTRPLWACPRSAKLEIPRKPVERRIGGWSPIEAFAWKEGPLRLAKSAEKYTEEWEAKTAFVLAPWDRRIECIIEAREAALTTHHAMYKRTQDDAVVYTDGSGFSGHIGAAAVNHQDEMTSERMYLGTEDQSTVYAAELTGIAMALARTIQNNKDELTPTAVGTAPTTARVLTIFSDSQAAIQAVQNPLRPSGQYVLGLIYDHVKVLRPRYSTVTLHRIHDQRGHVTRDGVVRMRRCGEVRPAERMNQ
jgi:ribonuclease HI